MMSGRAILWMSVLSVVLLAVALPRFNRSDVGPIKSLTGGSEIRVSNSDQYLAMTSYFKGREPDFELHPPYAYRPLVPFLASKLPFEAATAINIIGLLAMVLALFPIYGTLELLKISFPLRVVGGGLFAVSFPTFYYTAIGMVDPVAVFVVALGLYLVLKQEWLWLAAVVFLGMLVKETTVILVGVSTVYVLFRRKLFAREGLALIPTYAAFIVGLYLSRTWIPVSSDYVWVPAFKYFVANLVRPRSTLSFLLTFGIPGALSLLAIPLRKAAWFREHRAETVSLVAGIFLTIVLHVYSMVAAYADGRIIWLAYPFIIPLAMAALDEMRNRRLT